MKHSPVYHAECPEENSNDEYAHETARHIIENVIDHSGRDKSSHTLKNQIEKEHSCPQYKNFKIISSGYRRR